MKLYRNYNPITMRAVEATPADIIAAFNDLPLTLRMRAWHDTSAPEVNERAGFGSLAIYAYPEYADKFEREDAEKAHRYTEIEELAQVIRGTTGRLGSWDSIVESAREEYREQARAVLDAGYRRGESAAPSPGLHDCEYDDPRMCAWPGHRKAQS